MTRQQHVRTVLAILFPTDATKRSHFQKQFGKTGQTNDPIVTEVLKSAVQSYEIWNARKRRVDVDDDE